MDNTLRKSPPPAMQHWPKKNGNPNGRPDRTDQFSFILRPDSHGGIGVFATHAIMMGVALRLYDESPDAIVGRTVRPEEVPGEFIKFCVDETDGRVTGPSDFTRIDTVWYLNHSDMPNAAHRGDYIYRALRNIAAGEEILINYEAI